MTKRPLTGGFFFSGDRSSHFRSDDQEGEA